MTKRKPKVSPAKILIWDIESTNLNASFGTILCIGWKWYGEKKVHVPTILQHQKRGMLDDKHLVAEFARVFAECDYHVAHYGSRFDLPMINTKLAKYELNPLPPKPMVDTWRVARRELRMHSNRLQALAQYLDVAHQKTPISFDDWLNAAHGNKKAMREVVDHCEKDVLVLEEVFAKLRPWVREEPSAALFANIGDMDCTSCGSSHVTRKGFKVSRTRRYQQWQCQTCGKWMRSVASEKGTQQKLLGGY